MLPQTLVSHADALADTMTPPSTASLTSPMFPVVDPTMYALGPVIARGGMGQIRIGHDLRIGRKVAIKELHTKTHVLAARFVREARVAAQLQHPNILPIYEVGSWADGTPFYTMRLVDGRTLYQAFGAAGSLAARLALLPSVIAAAGAVAFAHASGIIHRDLTPANILVGEFGETVVIDWGLAKDLLSAADADAFAAASRAVRERARPAPVRTELGRKYRTGTTRELLTGSGIVIGTPAYMPLEQANGKRVDERADIYALGAILYHLVAGHPAYFARTAQQVLERVREAPPRPLAEVAPHAPRALIAIVDKAMARDSGDRYPHARALVEALQRFQTGLVVTSPPPSIAKRFARWCRQRRAFAVAVALTFGALGVYVAS